MPRPYYEKNEVSEDELTREQKRRSTELVDTIDSMLSQLKLSLYGTNKKNETDGLLDKFNDAIRTQMSSINHTSSGNTSSFLSKLYDSDIKNGNYGARDLTSFMESDNSEIINYISEAYRNETLKLADLKEISKQLIELNEAILIMRDTIVSPDTTEGSIARSFVMNYTSNDKKDYVTGVLENMEENYNLSSKIKNHIIPNTLTFGKYYVYCIPYSKIFTDHVKKVTDPMAGVDYMKTAMQYKESTLMEAATTNSNKKKENDKFISESADKFIRQFTEREKEDMAAHAGFDYSAKTFKAAVEGEIRECMEHITICNDSVPLPFVEEGYEAIAELMKVANINPDTQRNLFMEVMNEDEKKDGNTPEKENFDEFKGSYIKYIDPTHIRKIKILNKTVGYYYIIDEDIDHNANRITTSSLWYNRYDNNGKQKTIIDSLVGKIVANFDKGFLKNNTELKELIAEALMYYDMTNRKLRFQFIPAEYIVEFKINEDETGEGTSILEPSLFYAKLYLLLLLFKITSIVLFSNDTKVNYVKTSGLDRDVSRKIQQIARDKKMNQVNIYDLMSYTGLLKKIGSGTEMYIPVGRGGDRGFETEILSGQEVQINNELMELLRTSYILGTGVPSAIMNYLNEADFAKSIETANTRFAGRVMSAQIDFNKSITRLYRLLASQAGIMDDDLIESFSYVLTPPKFANNVIKSDAMSTFNGFKDYVINMMLGESWQSDENKTKIGARLNMKLCEKYMPTIDIPELNKWIDEIKLEIVEDDQNPKNKTNTDSIDSFVDEL